MEITYSSQAHSYNALLQVADASLALCRYGGEVTVGRLLSVIQRFGLQDRLGIRLLHKHNDILPTEIMYESSFIDLEGFALSTKAVAYASIGSLVPNSWQFVDGSYVPCEYADPSLVVDPEVDLGTYAEALREVGLILRETGTENLLGLCVHYSSFVDRHDPFERSALLEKTDVEERANVVRYVNRDDPAFTNSAKTKWRAVQSIDSEGNVGWTTACKCFCSVFPEGGHVGTKTHQYNPGGRS